MSSLTAATATWLNQQIQLSKLSGSDIARFEFCYGNTFESTENGEQVIDTVPCPFIHIDTDTHWVAFVRASAPDARLGFDG
jgi:hypothetical protein